MNAPVSHRRGEHVRHTVLAAAFDELAENGAGAATIAGVARRSGVHETTIYRRWVTKEKLFIEAMLSSSAEEIPTPDTGSIRGDLLAVVQAVIAYLTSPVGGAALHVAVSLTVDDNHVARQAFWLGRLNALRPVVERGVARGELRPDIDAGLLLETLVAPVHNRLLLIGETVDEQFGERIVDLVLEGAVRRRVI
ncbi:MAG TPA: TetR/AcrR family transcriptional regulator [Mycobacterium sp.]|nr:TetR/AcrR family transcriptional regulator [Mycobacterium sp.]